MQRGINVFSFFFFFHFATVLLNVSLGLQLWLFSVAHSPYVSIRLFLKVLSESMENYINKWNTTTLHFFFFFCPLLHIKSLINKLQSAILINTASSTSHLGSHSSKGMLQWCLGWGHGPGKKRVSSNRQMIKLFFCFWFREKYSLIYVVIFILWKSVIGNLVLTGHSFFPVAE